MLTRHQRRYPKVVAFDLSHKETVGVFYVREWERDIPSRGSICSRAWKCGMFGESKVMQDDWSIGCINVG